MSARIKVLGAILLLVSFALPMMKIAYHYADTTGNVKEYETWPRVNLFDCLFGCSYIIPEGAKPVYDDDRYALQAFDTSIQNMFRDAPLGVGILMLTYAWPTIATGLIRKRQRGRIVVALRVVEPLLWAWSATIVWLTSTQAYVLRTLPPHRMGLGGYVAFAALGLYAGGLFVSDVEAFRAWRERVRVRRLSP